MLQFSLVNSTVVLYVALMKQCELQWNAPKCHLTRNVVVIQRQCSEFVISSKHYERPETTSCHLMPSVCTQTAIYSLGKRKPFNMVHKARDNDFLGTICKYIGARIMRYRNQSKVSSLIMFRYIRQTYCSSLTRVPYFPTLCRKCSSLVAHSTNHHWRNENEAVCKHQQLLKV